MIEIGSRPVVILQAAPFCYGPASTSLAVAKELRKHEIALVWLAEGTSEELLLRDQNGDHIVHFSMQNEQHRRRWSYLIEEADAVLVNTDPEFAEYALELNPRTLYLDILYWMWHELPPVATRTARYIYEDFAHTDEQQTRIGLPANALRVGPLIDLMSQTPVQAPKQDHLVVSLGGLHRPDSGSRDLLVQYEQAVRTSLLEALAASSDFSEVYLAGGGDSSETTGPNGIPIHAGCLGRDEYLHRLATAKAAVLAPGLTGFYEAATYGTPSFYLPPHNYSQYLQLEVYKRFIEPANICDWKALGADIRLANNMPEADMLVAVNDILRGILGNTATLSTSLAAFLSGGWQRCETRPATEFVRSLESDSGHGPSLVKAEILKLIEDHTSRSVGVSRRRDPDAVPLPKKLTLELFSGCQLRCPLCPTGNHLQAHRPKGVLTLDAARRIVNALEGHVHEIDLFNWGEPFLNKNACEIIRLIADCGIRTTISSNLQTMPAPQDLLASGLNELIVSCHGYTQETYEKYMKGGEVAKTLRNLDDLLKALSSDSKLRIVLRYVVFSHNEHELPLMQRHFAGTAVHVEASDLRAEGSVHPVLAALPASWAAQWKALGLVRPN
ncbi:MAG: radical SAM protein [Alphaproteobacteria bacterium]|nr:radical SAM protein [Alphaproteobacteria bacterium]MBV9694465.1 radical SAM protein [Alphaproteobacteria bacterium]